MSREDSSGRRLNRRRFPRTVGALGATGRAGRLGSLQGGDGTGSVEFPDGEEQIRPARNPPGEAVGHGDFQTYEAVPVSEPV